MRAVRPAVGDASILLQNGLVCARKQGHRPSLPSSTTTRRLHMHELEGLCEFGQSVSGTPQTCRRTTSTEKKRAKLLVRFFFLRCGAISHTPRGPRPFSAPTPSSPCISLPAAEESPRRDDGRRPSAPPIRCLTLTLTLTLLLQTQPAGFPLQRSGWCAQTKSLDRPHSKGVARWHGG